ncbi:hypothetical protein JG688_00004039 [Phytophthora aleatoria]|uniref:Protein kinase domain-containing protein n=1 Tax=Phytophthora aleatoria TaxID=2496075 RepID=A0A8J5M7L1_9STRA|nr:hypothetical protein JG688_00004039 [Phytophthora aleatoria]
MKKAYEEITSTLESDGGSDLVPIWFIPWYELLIDEWEKLGEGGFGSVYRAKWLDSEVVVKRVILAGSSTNFDTSMFSLSTLSVSADPTVSEAAVKSTKREEALKMFRREVEDPYGSVPGNPVLAIGGCGTYPPPTAKVGAHAGVIPIKTPPYDGIADIDSLEALAVIGAIGLTRGAYVFHADTVVRGSPLPVAVPSSEQSTTAPVAASQFATDEALSAGQLSAAAALASKLAQALAADPVLILVEAVLKLMEAPEPAAAELAPEEAAGAEWVAPSTEPLVAAEPEREKAREVALDEPEGALKAVAWAVPWSAVPGAAPQPEQGSASA